MIPKKDAYHVIDKTLSALIDELQCETAAEIARTIILVMQLAVGGLLRLADADEVERVLRITLAESVKAQRKRPGTQPGDRVH